jgi:glucose-1-phosphate thymidylyltransferase
MDCGNKKCNCRNKFQCWVLQKEDTALVAVNVRIDNSTIIPPCYIGEDVFNQFYCRANVSLGKDATLQEVQLKQFDSDACTSMQKLDNAMIGNHVYFDGDFTSISIGIIRY